MPNHVNWLLSPGGPARTTVWRHREPPREEAWRLPCPSLPTTWRRAAERRSAAGECLGALAHRLAQPARLCGRHRVGILGTIPFRNTSRSSNSRCNLLTAWWS